MSMCLLDLLSNLFFGHKGCNDHMLQFHFSVSAPVTTRLALLEIPPSLPESSTVVLASWKPHAVALLAARVNS